MATVKDRIISNSRSKTLLRCEQQYFYRYVLHLRLKRTRLPLFKGDWMHQLLHAYYSGDDWQATHAGLSKKFNQMFDEEKEYYGDLVSDCKRIMSNYQWTWRDEPWKALEVEYDFPPRQVAPGWKFGGRIDLVVKDEAGVIWLVENKTTSSAGSSIEQRMMDPQTHLYFWALADQYKAKGVIFNYIRTKPPTIPERLKSGELSRRANIDTTARTYLSALKHYKLDPTPYANFIEGLRGREESFCWRNMVPQNKATVGHLLMDLSEVIRRIGEIETGRHPVRVIDFRCDSGCDYYDLCMTDLRGGDGPAIIKQFFTKQEKRGGRDAPTWEKADEANGN